VNIKRLGLVVSLFAALIPVQFSVSAQTVSRKASPAPRLLASLPESDAIAHIKVKQLLNDLMPRLLGSNSAKLAEVNADIDRFKTRTGLDPRAFEEVALGVRYSYPSDGITKLQTAALAKGTFSAAAMVAAGRIAANGRYREEKYQGRTIYVFSLDQNIKLLGVLDFTVRELAASPLDANTLALGDPTSIRSVIDASLGRKRSNAGLIALANQDPDAVIGFGGNISDQVLKNLDIGNAPIENDLSGVRQVYGTVGATEKDVELFIGAKTVSAEAARNLGDTLEGLKQLGALFVGRLSGARGILARSALTNLKIAKQANELQIRTAVAQAEIAPLVGN
jgi:hypothetical protein